MTRPPVLFADIANSSTHDLLIAGGRPPLYEMWIGTPVSIQIACRPVRSRAVQLRKNDSFRRSLVLITICRCASRRSSKKKSVPSYFRCPTRALYRAVPRRISLTRTKGEWARAPLSLSARRSPGGASDGGEGARSA